MIVHAYYLKDARVRRYAETLIEEGHELDVLCLREANELPCEEHRGVHLYRIKQSRLRGGILSYIFEYTSAFIRFFFKLNVLFFAGRRYDLIHIHNFPNFLVFTTIIQKTLGKKIILDVHDPMPELFSSKFKIPVSHPLIRLLYLEECLSTAFADFVIAANHYFRDLLVQRRCPAKKVGIVMNAPDEKIFNCKAERGNSNRKSGIFNILYVGTLAERYGLETSLRSIAKIKEKGIIPGIHFTVIPKIKNEGEYVDWLLREVRALDLENCFSLLDPVPHHLMPHIIRNADISLYTPLPDIHMDIALSLKIPEIIAVGRPLVTSRLSVLQRYFDEEALFMCEPGNIDDCAEKILEVYQKPEEARLRIERAKKMLSSFSWENQKIVYIKIIENLTKRKFSKNKIISRGPTRRMRLKKLARNLISSVVYYSGLSSIWYWLFAKRAVRILTYHGIEISPTNSFAVTLNNFENQMQYLKERFNVISLPQFSNCLVQKKSFARDTVIITFDDGFKNFYQFAYPILKKYQIPATCFIITSKVGNPVDNFMNWEEINELLNDGLITIGSHTISHESLPTLNDLQLQNEIRGSKDILEKNLDMTVEFFSYPYGTRNDFDHRCINFIKNNEYRLALTAINGVNINGSDLFRLRRTKIEWGDDFPTFKRILLGALDIWAAVDYFLAFLQNKSEVHFTLTK
jgi:peptidoglycan/xylan/chitin deacetylase (PgdA/CDA1 family)/glycosyltransferase involved in cell wall biosynthesis